MDKLSVNACVKLKSSEDDIEQVFDRVLSEYNMDRTKYKRLDRISNSIEKVLKSYVSKENKFIENEKEQDITIITKDNKRVKVPEHYITYISTLNDMIEFRYQSELKLDIPEKYLRYILHYIKSGEVSGEVTKKDVQDLFYYADFYNISNRKLLS